MTIGARRPESGGGRYDALATSVLEATHAEAIVLVVLGGVRGSGFEVQLTRREREVFRAMADKLRAIADELELEAAAS